MSDVAIVQADASGRICMWNDGAEALLGYPMSRAIGQTLDMIVPEAFRAHHWNGFHAAMDRRGTKQDEPFLLPILCADGQTKYFAGRLMFLRNAYDEAVGALAIFVAEREAPELFRL